MSNQPATFAVVEHYELRQSPRRKTMALRVEHQRLVVLAPQHIRQREIQRFIHQHSDWIKRQVRLQQSREQAIMQKQFKHGGEFTFLGQPYTLNVISGSKHAHVMLQDQHILMHLPQDDSASVKVSLFAWYRQQAQQYFTHQTHETAAITDKTCRQIRIGDFKRQWGSCSRQGIIRYHWPLIQACQSVIDYVIAHEVSHLTYMNYSADFWQLVKRLCPDYQVQRRWLKDQGHLLRFLLG